MKRKVASLVIIAYISAILLMLLKHNISTKLYEGIMYALIIVSLISFLFGVAERTQLYKFWPKGEILMCTPPWFKMFYWVSALFIPYLAFASDFEFTEMFVLINLALGTGYLSSYLFVSKITVDEL